MEKRESRRLIKHPWELEARWDNDQVAQAEKRGASDAARPDP